MTLTLTVLGCSGTHTGRERMCSSYLVTAEGYRLLLDCGNGSLANLQRVCDVADVDAVLISHTHPDHFADLYGLYYALRFHAAGPQPVRLYGPSGFLAFAGQLIGSDDMFGEVCRFEAAKAGQQLQLGPLTVSLFAANHPVETLACRVEAGGRALTYTADSAPSPALVHAARDCDLLLADATWLERQRPLPADVHMTGKEAGQLAADSGARRLIVTHVYPSNDPEETVIEAAGVYDGDIVAAYDLLEVSL